jgi:flagellar hook-associated protein 1 FlgK
MSITGALFNALTGLTATSRGIEVVSSNVANARTEGYARRELLLESQTLGSHGTGVRVIGVQRMVDQGILADLRLADAAVAAGDTRLAFHNRIGGLVGTPGEPGSLSDRIAVLQAALVEASNRPDNGARLVAAVAAASEIATRLNSVSDDIQTTRIETDDEIGRVVAKLNDDLGKVRDLNVEIRKLDGAGRDYSALADQRQKLIGEISAVVPVRELPRDNGMIALVSPGGALLLDGQPAEIGFASVGFITADMTLASGALSGLTVNGRPSDITGGNGALGGGRLGALFDIRDGLAPEAQGMIDALARDLHDRFADPSLDPTITAGQPGLFTDNGAALAPLDEVGLAGRLKINAQVDPAQGGAAWRLRAGIYAASPNAAGDGALIAALADRLEVGRVPASGPFGSSARGAGALAGEASALWSGRTQSLEKGLTYAGSRADTLRNLHLQDGVDTDHEMQELLALEHAYAANARVVSTVDDMMQTLLGL